MDRDQAALKGAERIFALALGVVAASAVVVGLSYALPLLEDVVWTTVHVAVGAGILAVIAVVVSDEGVRRTAVALFRLLVRTLWRAIVRYDPVGALKDHVERLRGKLAEIDRHRQALAGVHDDLARSLGSAKDELERSLGLATAAKRLADGGDDDARRVVALEGRKAERRRETIVRMEEMRTKFRRVAEILTRIRGKAEFVLLDTEDEVHELIRRQRLADTAGLALEQALDLIHGDPALRRQYEDIVGIMEAKVAQRLGLIELFLDDTDGLMASIRVEDAMWEEKALRAIEARSVEIDGLVPLDPARVRPSAGLPASTGTGRTSAALRALREGDPAKSDRGV